MSGCGESNIRHPACSWTPHRSGRAAWAVRSSRSSGSWAPSCSTEASTTTDSAPWGSLSAIAARRLPVRFMTRRMSSSKTPAGPSSVMKAD